MKLLVAIAASLSLMGCSTPLIVGGTGDSPAVAVGDKVLVHGTNALADAADAYSVVAQTAAAVIRAGVPKLSDDQVRMVRTLNDQAIKLINGGDQALTVAQRAASLTVVVSQLRSIVGSN